MLDGLDAVAWDELSHAYGGATDTPGLLRQVASPDAEQASAAMSELYGSIFQQGTVYAATVAAVPFLVELAGEATHQRRDLLLMLGLLADERHAYGEDFVDVLFAVAEHLDALTALLYDHDPRVREAAVYAATRAGVSAAQLQQRGKAEDDPVVRAALLLALAEVDPMNSVVVLDDAPQVRVAAAVVMLRRGAERPPGTVHDLVEAMNEGGAVAWEWSKGAEWSEELVCAPPARVAVAVVEEMLRSGNPGVRGKALWAVGKRCRARRSAPRVFVPLIAPALGDSDLKVRTAAMHVLYQAGAAAGQFADVLRREPLPGNSRRARPHRRVPGGADAAAAR